MYGTLGPERGDVLAAMVQTTVANVFRSEKSKPAKVKDFMPEWDRKPQDWREQLTLVKMINAAYGGRVSD